MSNIQWDISTLQKSYLLKINRHVLLPALKISTYPDIARAV